MYFTKCDTITIFFSSSSNRSIIKSQISLFSGEKKLFKNVDSKKRKFPRASHQYYFFNFENKTYQKIAKVRNFRIRIERIWLKLIIAMYMAIQLLFSSFFFVYVDIALFFLLI